MKTISTALVFLLTALGTLTASMLAAAETPARIYRVTEVNTARNDRIKVGTWIEDVRNAIGVPIEMLTDDMWVYSGFHAKNDDATRDGCCGLVIAFERGHVSSIHMANPQAMQVVRRRIRAGTIGNSSILAAVLDEPATKVADAVPKSRKP